MVMGGFLLYCCEQGRISVLYMMLYNSGYVITPWCSCFVQACFWTGSAKSMITDPMMVAILAPRKEVNPLVLLQGSVVGEVPAPTSHLLPT